MKLVHYLMFSSLNRSNGGGYDFKQNTDAKKNIAVDNDKCFVELLHVVDLKYVFVFLKMWGLNICHLIVNVITNYDKLR